MVDNVTLDSEKAGITGKDDTLPKRMLEEPLLKGKAEGQVVRLAEMLPDYYKLRGWDRNGILTLGKIAQLGLSQMEYIERRTGWLKEE
ncbi:hypothetical protein ES703_95967 [subsurface metagenome]